MLNGKELVEKGIVTKVPSENVAQHGCDLNVIKIERLMGIGFIPITGKTKLPEYQEVETVNNIWRLNPGVYSVVFSQGCKVPADQMLLIRQRSSFARCGGQVHSSVFDAGFYTENMGTFIVVLHPMDIEFGARIAQVYNHVSDPVENLYDGQFQNDQQRVK